MKKDKQEKLASEPDKELNDGVLSEDELDEAKLQQAKVPLLEALERAGVYVSEASDLQWAYDADDYPVKAIPILIEHYKRPYPFLIRRDIANALCTPAAIHSWKDLLGLFESELEPDLKWDLGWALSEAATDDVIDDVIRLVKEPEHGDARANLLDAFVKSASPQARQVLEELCAEPSYLGYEAQKRRARIRRMERDRDRPDSALKIYKTGGIDNYEYFRFFVANRSDYLDVLDAIDNALDGSPRTSSWQPVSIEIINKDENGRKLRFADALSAHGLLVFRESVIEKMGPLLLEYGELLPLECAEAKLWLYNATFVLDALNEEESEIDRNDDGSIVVIDWPVFCEEAIGDADIFKLSIFRTGPIYFSQRFVDLWKKSGLKGLKFQQVNDLNPFQSLVEGIAKEATESIRFSSN